MESLSPTHPHGFWNVSSWIVIPSFGRNSVASNKHQGSVLPFSGGSQQASGALLIKRIKVAYFPWQRYLWHNSRTNALLECGLPSKYMPRLLTGITLSSARIICKVWNASILNMNHSICLSISILQIQYGETIGPFILIRKASTLTSHFTRNNPLRSWLQQVIAVWYVLRRWMQWEPSLLFIHSTKIYGLCTEAQAPGRGRMPNQEVGSTYRKFAIQWGSKFLPNTH